jgi:hypothetical protein
MYSLVSAPVLGFDLVRLPGGSAVADVLLHALALTHSDVEIVAAGWSADWDRVDLWQDVQSAAQQRQVLRDRSAAYAEVVADPAAELAGALTVIESCPLGTIDGLLHCVRYDVLDWTWHPVGKVPQQRPSAPNPGEQAESANHASSVICDAAASAYLRELLPDATRRRLAAPWVSASRALPERDIDLGPQHAAILEVLARIESLPPSDIERLTRAAESTRRSLADWAPAVHSASWAVFLSSRVRAAAAAQLMLVQAIDRSGVTLTARAGGVWNLLSGAVQALVVRDLLDTTTVHRLVDPYLAALGPLANP